MLPEKLPEKRAKLAVVVGSRGEPRTIPVQDQARLLDIGVSADGTTGRVTFDKKIMTVKIAGAGENNKTLFRMPLLGGPIETDIPLKSKFPTASQRIEFRTLTGEPAIIYGLPIED